MSVFLPPSNSLYYSLSRYNDESIFSSFLDSIDEIMNIVAIAYPMIIPMNNTKKLIIHRPLLPIFQNDIPLNQQSSDILLRLFPF